MKRTAILSRRRFLETASIAAATLVARPQETLASGSSKLHFAIVGSMGCASKLHLYSFRGKDWQWLQTLPTKSPVAVLLHPNQETLYVLNQIDEHEGLPRGTVETYRLHRGNGALTLQSRQPLSLSATSPRHMALSPAGDSLVVAVAGGGAYNLLPVHTNGELGRVSRQRKETGSGPIPGHQDSSHPQTVLFAPRSNIVVASDLGADRLSIFSIERGIELTSRIAMPQGSGPRNLAFHPEGQRLFVDHALEGALSVFSWNHASPISAPSLTPSATTRGPFGDALAIHPAGKALYAAGRGLITAWSIRDSGPILPMQSIAAGPVRSLTICPDLQTLSASTPTGVIHLDIASTDGLLSNLRLAASVPEAHSILFL